MTTSHGHFTIRLSDPAEFGCLHFGESVDLSQENNDSTTPHDKQPPKRRSSRQASMTATFAPSSTRRRTRQASLRLSETSPAFVEMKTLTKDDSVRSENLIASTSNAVTKFALVRAIQPNDSLEFIYSLSQNKKFKCSSSKVDVHKILNDDKYYPVNLEFHRTLTVDITPSLDESTPSPKRRRGNKKKQSQVLKKEPSFISLLSSDEEDNASTGQDEATDKQMVETKANALVSTDTPSVNNNPTSPSDSTMIARPDPIPGYQADEWVLTSLGPGCIESFRIDRLPDSRECLVHPILMYQVRLSFGTLFVCSKQLQPFEGSPYAKETIVSTPQGSLARADIFRLQPGIYLNDNFINFYLARLESSNNNNKVHIFSSYFYTRIANLSEGKTVPCEFFNQIKGWLKHVNIWNMDMLLFPIHYRLHWSLVAVCHPGLLLLQSEKDEEGIPSILHVDSGKRFRLHTASTIFNRIRTFLQVCIAQQHGVEMKLTKSNLPGGAPPVPAQANETDCGVFLLEWVERLIQSNLTVTHEFVDAKGDMPPFGKTAFPQSLMDRKRHDFQSLVYTLSSHQGGT